MRRLCVVVACTFIALSVLAPRTSPEATAAAARLAAFTCPRTLDRLTLTATGGPRNWAGSTTLWGFECTYGDSLTVVAQWDTAPGGSGPSIGCATLRNAPPIAEASIGVRYLSPNKRAHADSNSVSGLKDVGRGLAQTLLAEAEASAAACPAAAGARPTANTPPQAAPPPPSLPDPSPGAEEPPRILSMDEQVQRCGSTPGAARDECLAGVSVVWEDPSPCDQEPQGGCRQLAASTLMARCQSVQDQAARVLCATGVATRWKDPGSCSIANEVGREECLLIVATEARNPRVLMDNVFDDLLRDGLLSTYAAAARDPDAISLIASDEAFDRAVLLTFTVIAMDRRQVDTSHCARLRASDSTGIDQVACRKLVAWAVQVAEGLDAAEAEGRGSAFLAQLQTVLQGSTGELGEQILATPDPGDVGAVP